MLITKLESTRQTLDIELQDLRKTTYLSLCQPLRLEPYIRPHLTSYLPMTIM